MEEDYEILTDVTVVGRVEEITALIDGFIPNVPEDMRPLIRRPSYDPETELIAMGNLYGGKHSVNAGALPRIKALRTQLRDYGTVDALRKLLESDPTMWVNFNGYTRWRP